MHCALLAVITDHHPVLQMALTIICFDAMSEPVETYVTMMGYTAQSSASSSVERPVSALHCCIGLATA